MKHGLLVCLLFIAHSTVAQNWLLAAKQASTEEAGLMLKQSTSVLFYLYSDNGDNGFKIQSTGVAGEGDATPRIHAPYASPNLFLVESGGNVGVGTSVPNQRLDVRGHLVLDPGSNPIIYTGVGGSELYRYLSLINSSAFGSASGLKAGGVLVSDTYSYANPGKNDLIVKGDVGIGTSTPDSKLTVNGTIHSKEVKVDLAVPAPDYVFEKDYKLPSLEEIKTYIDKNKHLPEVPSAIEMEMNGVQLGEMNMMLLKKIEELTLYVIKQNSLIQIQNERIGKLENK